MTRLCTTDAVLLKIVMFINADRRAHNSESTLNQRGFNVESMLCILRDYIKIASFCPVLLLLLKFLSRRAHSSESTLNQRST